MERVNVLVTNAMGDEALRLITNVSPKIKLTDVTDLFRADQIYYKAEESDALGAKEKLNALLAEAEVIYGTRLPHNLFKRVPRLKWIQLISAGVDKYLDAETAVSPVILTNMSGVCDTPIAEFVLGLMLMFVKQMPIYVQLKPEKRWLEWGEITVSMLRSKTVGVVGLGSIGREVARLAKSFGMRVLATRRSATRVGRARYVDIMYPSAQLQQLLAESDFVVLTLPLTLETEELIGEEELRSMKSTAYLINIARGGIVNEEVLIRALDERWIAGAGLDVFVTEPLPPDSRLWELPNVIISPHISGDREDYFIKATEVFTENLKRYLEGKKLRNLVDKKKGY